MDIKNLELSLILAAFVSSCTPSPVAEQLETTISGSAYFDGIIVPRRVHVFDYSTGRKGAFLASVPTDKEGTWSLGIGANSGTFVIEADLEGTKEADRISAIVPDVAFGAHREHVAINIFSHLARVYADHLIAKGEELERAIHHAQSRMFAHFGRIDHTKIQPVNLRQPANADMPLLGEVALSGALVEGLVEQANRLRESGDGASDPITVTNLVRLYVRDLSNGVFDGLGEYGARLHFGAGFLHGDSLRLDYADAIRRFLDGPKNASSLRSTDITFVLDAIRHNESELFLPIVSRDNQGPELVSFAFFSAEGRPLEAMGPFSNAVELRIEAQDESEVMEIRIEAAPTSTALFGPDEDPTPAVGIFGVNTRTVRDGKQFCTAVLIDKAGNETRKTFEFTVDNEAPSVSLNAPSASLTSTVTVHGTAFDTVGPVVVRIFVQDQAQLEVPVTQDIFQDVVVIPCDGQPVEVLAIASDAAGNTSTPAAQKVYCDTEHPQIGLISTRFFDERDVEITQDASERLVYTPKPSGRQTVISEQGQWPVTVHKLFNRLDDTPETGGAVGANLPVLRLRISDGQFGVQKATYRYLTHGVEQRRETELSLDRQGEALLPISLQALGSGLLTSPRSALHEIEIRAFDEVGHETRRVFGFFLELLSPPVLLKECRRTPDLTWLSLAENFTISTEVPVVEAVVRYQVDLPKGTLVPPDEVTLSLEPSESESALLEAVEHKFTGPWVKSAEEVPSPFGPGYPPISVTCDSGLERFEITNDWNQATQSGESLYPESNLFWVARVNGALNERSVHPLQYRITLPNGAEVVPLGTRYTLSHNSALRLTTSLVTPRITRNGAPYDFRTSLPPVPAGLTSSRSTAGQYFLADLSRTGSEQRTTIQWRCRRNFVTRATVGAIATHVPAPTVRAEHSRWPTLPVEVRVSERCAEPFVVELRP